jgi:Na+/H+-dicarboxylate symporter
MISFTFTIAAGVSTTGELGGAGAFTTSTLGVTAAVAIFFGLLQSNLFQVYSSLATAASLSQSSDSMPALRTGFQALPP